MEHILKFLKAVGKNNNREWFEKNKAKYLEAKEGFDDFLERFHKDLVKLDERLAGLNPRKAAFRIYRDVRFSKDKSPYKTNMGAGFSPNGKMDMEPGYYIHIQPNDKSFIAGGLYMPSPEQLSKVRQEIDYNSSKILKVLNDRKFKAYYKGLDEDGKLKTMPKGYAKDHPNIELLKNKSFVVSHVFTDKEVTDKTFLKKVVDGCKLIKPLNDYLGEAIE
jgi:uncharacterized protein (TIGR02453 family)